MPLNRACHGSTVTTTECAGTTATSRARSRAGHSFLISTIAPIFGAACRFAPILAHFAETESDEAVIFGAASITAVFVGITRNRVPGVGRIAAIEINRDEGRMAVRKPD